VRCARQFNVSGFRKLGYETRIIALFDTDGEGLRSHTFLDVKNPGTGKWETQDPEFDLYWMSKSSGVRVSLADAAENYRTWSLATSRVRAAGNWTMPRGSQRRGYATFSTLSA
jgi:hypothetical protein